MSDTILKEESYKIIGVCMEVHRQLGMGFKEIVHKDASGIEFNNQGIPFSGRNSLRLNIKELFYHINNMQTLLFMILLFWKLKPLFLL
jgi:GxxExxY protein